MRSGAAGARRRGRGWRTLPTVGALGIVALLWHPSLTGQGTPEAPGEPIENAAPVLSSRVGDRCLDLPRPEEPFALSGGRLVSTMCRVTEAGPLIRTDSIAWRWALYRHELVYGAASGVAAEDRGFFPDTVREDELVLFVDADRGAADPGPGEAEAPPVWRPVWHDLSHTSTELLRPPRAGASPDAAGAALLAHRRCANGTAGCMDFPYRLAAGGSVIPLRAAYLAQLGERLPGGWGTWKGVWLEPEGPRAEAAVYVPRDANCCPSFQAVAALGTAGDSLFLDSLALTPRPTSFGWEVAPETSFGYVDARTSEEELVEAYGPDAVRRAAVYQAEGFCTPGTVVFPEAPWRMEVAWADSARSRPAFARATGSEGPWHTPAGVRLGTTVSELEAIRGEPVTFGAFGWDYGGGLWWEEGAGSLGLLVGPDSASNRRLHGDLREQPGSEGLFGERSVRSDHPLVRQLVIRVWRMTLRWANPAISRDCEGS